MFPAEKVCQDLEGYRRKKRMKQPGTEPAGPRSPHADLYKNLRSEYFRAKDDL